MKTICKKWKLSFVLITLFALVLNSFTAFADINHLMIGTDSNALMTLELDDSDYLMMSPRSTLGTVTNTIESNILSMGIRYVYDKTGEAFNQSKQVTKSNGRYSFYHTVPEGYSIENVVIWLNDNLPNTGKYKFSFDYASDFAHDWSEVYTWYYKSYKNSNADDKSIIYDFDQFSGDVYISPVVMQLSNVSQYCITLSLDKTDHIRNIGGSFAIRFARTDEEPEFVVGSDTSASDYQDGVSSSLSDLSSSVDEVSDEIGFVAEAIQNLQGAMEPHYNNVLTQLHHITEQLHAFYDQIYNNIHLKEYALWQDIKTAIENIDLEVNVNLDKLKTSIDNMSQAVQNKLQSVTDTITGGYNNSGMQEDNNELSGAFDKLDNAEQEVLDDVNGYIEGFEYPSFDGISSGIIGALSFFGGFLHSIFLGMGEFGLIITFSLTMIFVLIIVGYHRIRS